MGAYVIESYVAMFVVNLLSAVSFAGVVLLKHSGDYGLAGFVFGAYFLVSMYLLQFFVIASSYTDNVWKSYEGAYIIGVLVFQALFFYLTNLIGRGDPVWWNIFGLFVFNCVLVMASLQVSASINSVWSVAIVPHHSVVAVASHHF